MFFPPLRSQVASSEPQGLQAGPLNSGAALNGLRPVRGFQHREQLY